MFDCYAEGCAPCKRMKEETFPDPRVKKLLDERCLFVTVDVEKTGSSPLPPAETVTGESTTSTTHQRQNKQAKPGKLPPLPKHSTDTSRDAAADALRQFFKRR